MLEVVHGTPGTRSTTAVKTQKLQTASRAWETGLSNSDASEAPQSREALQLCFFKQSLLGQACFRKQAQHLASGFV